jgi:NarL family two-component system response regulator LiaR
MPEMDGLAATRMIRQRHSQLQVIALTSFREKELVQDALQAGAISYLLKDVSANDLAEAIRAAYAGQPTLIPEAASVLVQMTGQRLPSDYELSLREQEVLALMVKGLNNREIAGRLVVSPSTARAHVSHILAKLGVSNRAEAIALALRQRWSLD